VNLRAKDPYLANPDAGRVMAFRDRIARYVDKLVAAGQNDRPQLITYARAYSKELHEGRDPRFTSAERGDLVFEIDGRLNWKRGEEFVPDEHILKRGDD